MVVAKTQKALEANRVLVLETINNLLEYQSDRESMSYEIYISTIKSEGQVQGYILSGGHSCFIRSLLTASKD